MNLKRFPKNDHTLRNSSFHEEQAGLEFSVPELKPHSSLKFTTPKPIPPRKGKKLVAIAVIAAFSYITYSAWNTYFRYDAHGIITANVVGVYSPYEGNLRTLSVSEGEYVEKNSIIGHVTNPEHYRNLEKIVDEIQITRGELQSRQSELSWREGSNNETYFKAEGEMLAVEGSLNELRANLVLLSSNLIRMKALQKEGAVSRHELDKALSEVAATKALITSREKTLISMRERLNKSQSLISNTGADQLEPLKQKLVFLNNEKQRLENKISEGHIISPVSGIVSTIESFAGERVDSDRILSIVEDNTSTLVLYYDPNKRLPEIGDDVSVWSPSYGKQIAGTVSGISRDSVDAPTQIQKNYAANSKLIRVFVNAQEVDINEFVVGSTIKQPNFLDRAINLMGIVRWASGSEAFAGEENK